MPASRNGRAADSERWAAYASRFSKMGPEEKATAWAKLTDAQRQYLSANFNVTPKWYKSKTKLTVAVFVAILLLVVYVGMPWKLDHSSKDTSPTGQQNKETPKESTTPPSSIPNQLSTTMMLSTKTGNIRSAPSREAPLLKKANYGDFLTVIEKRGEWTRVAWAGGAQGWIQSSSLVGQPGILQAGKREIEKRYKQQEVEKKKLTQKLISSYQQLGLKKIDDQGIVLWLQWDEGQWAFIPFDMKQQILDSFRVMKGGTAVVRIRGYYSGGTLAETGVFSDTIK
jgi:SH3-like domain-containing protein